jgi:hypothetical protein
MKGAKIKNTIKVVAIGGLLSLGSFVGAVSAYMGQPGPNPNAPQYYANGTANYYGQGVMVNNQFRMQGQGMGQGRMNGQGQIGQDDIVQSQTLQYVMQLPKQPLDEQEINDIEHMREEEKLARDVYLTLYNKWGLPIFKNIARSEQNHMDAVKVLIDKYGLEDPVEETGDQIGVFKNPEIQELYNKLVEQGSQSLEDALKVGATIEDLDIYDLEKALSDTDNEDLKIIWQNLMKGSRNHLRAFESQLEARFGTTYQCQYLSEEQCQQIINSDWERGISYGPNGEVLFNQTPMMANHQMGPGMNNQFGNQGNQFGPRQGNNGFQGQGQGMGRMNGQFGNGMQGQGQMGMGFHGRGPVNIEMIRQNKEQFMMQIRQREQMIKQQIQQVKERVMMELRERKRLDPQTKQEVIQVIQQALITKLEALLVEIVGTPLEDKYAQVIQDLITKAQNATSVDELKALVMEYIKLKQEINAELQVEVNTNTTTQ